MSRIMGFLHDEIARENHTVKYMCAEDVPCRWHGRIARFAFPFLVRQHAIEAARCGAPYDIINVHEPAGAAIARFRRAAGNPMVVVMSHGLEKRGWKVELEESRLGRGGPSLKSQIVYPLTSLWQSRLALQYADHILCTNTQDSAYLVERLQIAPERITRISPGASLIYAKLACNRDYARAERLLFAGTWIKRKGIADVIAAFQQLGDRYPQLRLIVLGGGVPEAVILRCFPNSLQERIDCIETNNETETAGVFASADLYLLPSLFEGTPLTLIEAMMSGLPIVTTATCGMLVDRI